MIPEGEQSGDMRRLKTQKEISVYRFQFVLNFQSKKTDREKIEFIFEELQLVQISYKEFVSDLLVKIL